MLKKIVFGLSLLFLIIALLIGYQWFMYEQRIQHADRVQQSDLEIGATVVHTNGTLGVTQTISNIEQDSYLIKLPEGTENIECQLPNEEECHVDGYSSKQTINIGNVPSITFTYTLPINENIQSIWLENIFIEFFKDEQEEIHANYTVNLSDKVDKSIQWISGGLTEVQVAKENLSYFAWTKKETTELPLYMSKQQLQKIDTYDTRVTIYTSDQEKARPTLEAFQVWYEQIPQQSGLTVVLAADEDIIMTPLLVVAPLELPAEDIEELTIRSYLLHNNQPATDEISWMWNVLPTFILNRPVGQGKELEMSTELVEIIGEKTRSDFASWLATSNGNQRDTITTNDLDEKLSSLSNFTTTFFTENKNQQAPLTPLFYIDKRPILYNDKKINEGWNAIARKDTIHFPLVNTMEALDFTVTIFSDSPLFLLTKGGNSWRLYLNETYYIFNQENYGVTNRPLVQIGEEVYISERWLEEIFRIEVIKRDEGIYLR